MSSQNKTIAITSVTGVLGRAIVDQLKKGTNLKIAALLPNNASIPEETRNWIKKEFHIIIQYNPADSSARLDSVNYLLVLPSIGENRVAEVENIVEVARRSNIEFLMLQSILDPGKGLAFSNQFKAMEKAVIESGIPGFTILRCTWFTENLFLQCDNVREKSVIQLPIGRTAPLSVTDLAHVVVAVFTNDPYRYSHKAYDLAGPEVLDGNHLAQAASRALGRNITFETISTQVAIRDLLSKGVSESLAKGMIEMIRIDSVASKFTSADTNSAFEELTGKKATTVTEWFSNNVSMFTGQMGAGQMGAVTLSVAQMGNQMDREIQQMRHEVTELISKREANLAKERRAIKEDQMRLSEYHREANKLRKRMEYGSEHKGKSGLMSPEKTPERRIGKGKAQSGQAQVGKPPAYAPEVDYGQIGEYEGSPRCAMGGVSR
jgi:NAD(P)H dehydrogenase (quinone)